MRISIAPSEIRCLLLVGNRTRVSERANSMPYMRRVVANRYQKRPNCRETQLREVRSPSLVTGGPSEERHWRIERASRPWALGFGKVRFAYTDLENIG
jgi:hypothetical protein